MAVNKRNFDRRKPELRPVSSAAEICETRALLSATAVDLPAVDIGSADSELSSEESVDLVESEEIGAELAVCTMLPGDSFFADLTVIEDAVDDSEGDPLEDELVHTMFVKGLSVEGEGIEGEEGELVECEVVETDLEFVDPELADWQPSWSFRTLTAAVDEGEESEGELLESDSFEVTSDDVDPSWMFQSFLPLEENEDLSDSVDPDSVLVDPPVEITELEVGLDGEEVVFLSGESPVDVTTMEDYDPSWAYRGVVVDGGEVLVDESDENVEVEDVEVLEKEEVAVDSEMDGELISEEVTLEEVVDVETVGDGSVIPVRFLGGPQFRGATGGGELPMEILMSASGIGGGLEPVDVEGDPSSPGVVQGSNAVIVPQVVGPFLTSLPTAVAQPVLAPAIPLLNSQSTVLFEDEQEVGYVGTLLSSSDEEVAVAGSLTDEAVPSSLDSDLGGSISADAGESSGELDVLTPLLNTESETGEEEAVEVPASEEIPAEATEEPVSSVATPPEMAAEESVHTVSAPTSIFAPRVRSARAIDSFMTEFSLSGFIG